MNAGNTLAPNTELRKAETNKKKKTKNNFSI